MTKVVNATLLGWPTWVNTLDFFPPSILHISTEITQGCREGDGCSHLLLQSSMKPKEAIAGGSGGETSRPASRVLPWFTVAQLSLFLMLSADTTWPERCSLLASHLRPSYIRASRGNPALLLGHLPTTYTHLGAPSAVCTPLPTDCPDKCRVGVLNWPPLCSTYNCIKVKWMHVFILVQRRVITLIR